MPAGVLGALSPASAIPSLQGGNAGPSEATGSSNSDGLAATNITLGGSFAVGGNSKADTGNVGGGQSAQRGTPASISGIPDLPNFVTPVLIGLGTIALFLVAWKIRK